MEHLLLSLDLSFLTGIEKLFAPPFMHFMAPFLSSFHNSSTNRSSLNIHQFNFFSIAVDKIHLSI